MSRACGQPERGADEESHHCHTVAGHGGRGFAQTSGFDADGDGRITRREFIDAREQRFVRMDKNGDGFIRADDFRRLQTSASVRQRLAQLLADADFDRDGA